jgi:NAD-dependent DNA ligase
MDMLRQLEVCGISCVSPHKAKSSQGKQEGTRNRKKIKLGSSSPSFAGDMVKEADEHGMAMSSEELLETCRLSGLAGKTFVVTGSLSVRALTRNQFSDLLTAHGAVLADNVNAKVHCVILGEKPGKSKIEKAKKSGVALLSEEEFWETYGKED